MVIGLGAMLGTGAFTVWAPAAAAAGWWLLGGLVLAAGVATCNALSSADLASAYPESGGAYVYGRERLGHLPGVAAGVAFLVGKTASSAAAALVFAEYAAGALPDAGRHAVAAAAVLAVTGLNLAGVRWTARGLRVLVAVVIVVLVGFAVTVVIAGPGSGTGETGPAGSPLGVAESAALIFFAFAGYARIATLGEEVRDPARTLRRAIPLALSVAVLIYAAVAMAVLAALGPARLATSPAPLADALRAVGADGLVPVVRIGASVATLAVLLSVLVGVSRTALAMARRRDLPPALAAVSRRGTPWRADLAAAAVVLVWTVLFGPGGAVALSAGSVLVYYAIANAAAITLAPHERRWPRWTAYAGLVGCLGLAVALVIGLTR